ncbi:hypothetical protein L1049_004308 [Liquidambar formosana]|uniref:BSD domain-containing protein n=1 Tax=Liquidambar formosana TaxID=63359 RepID=A0AAP0WW13_LIQFO
MDFFKSVFSDDPDPKPHESESPKKEEIEPEEDDPYPDSSPNAQNPNPNSALSDGGGRWSFGGLIKTLTTKSESVIETYRRDLKEFGSGLKKETETFREVANRAVKELPTSIEASASVAQGSLETVGQAIDEFGSNVWKGTAQIISHGKDTLLADDNETELSDNQNYSNQNQNSKHYNRFDTRVRAIQSDLSTYCEEPDDLDDYGKWKSGFALEEKEEEFERLFEENGVMEGIYTKVVPNEVDRETFWCRYFYKVYKLKQAEDVRVNFVKRAISREDDEEDLSWDVDDDDFEETNVSSKAVLLENRELGGNDSGRIVKEENLVKDLRVGDSGVVDVDEMAEDRSKSIVEDLGWEVDNDDEETNVLTKVDSSEKRELGSKDSLPIVEEKSIGDSEVGNSADVDEKRENRSNVDGGDKDIVAESSGDNSSNEEVQLGRSSEMNKDELVSKFDEKMVLQGKAEPGESCKDNDFTVVSSQPSLPEEEDLGWDEIEDLGSGDEKKITHGGSPNRADLRKRLSAADEDEDLSWDIEDDDEPVKA